MFSEEVKQKRIRNEMAKLQKSNLGFAQIYPNENNPREFHFLLKGHDDSEYKGGYYIGKISIDKDYPAKAGDFMMLTPSGRFDINKNICLSNSAYHQDQHTPLWSIENMVIGMASIFHEEDHDKNGKPKHSISHRYDSKEQRMIYASQSLHYNMTNYPNLFTKFTHLIDEHGFPKVNANQITQEKEPKKKLQQTTEKIETKPVEIILPAQVVEQIETKPVGPVVEHIETKPVEPKVLKVTTKKPKQKKTLLESMHDLILPKKSSQLTERSEQINQKINEIKDMPFEKFDIKAYKELNDLISPVNLSEI
jgi:ubiquitin-conjugating enzyme E2 J2